MHPTKVLKELAQSHYLYRRAGAGSAARVTQRTRIAIYQRLYHAATGIWPEMPLINATINRYQAQFWQLYIRCRAADKHAAPPITNSGPGGPNCRASSAETCRCKGTTREFKKPPTKKNYCAVDRSASPHKQTAQLTNALVKAAKDGARLEAVLYRPEFGELILDCGNSGPTHPSRMAAKEHHGHGVQHVLEKRHNVTPYSIASTLIFGNVSQDPNHPSRLRIKHGKYLIVLEREMKAKSGRISPTKAKLHTATHIS